MSRLGYGGGGFESYGGGKVRKRPAAPTAGRKEAYSPNAEMARAMKGYLHRMYPQLQQGGGGTHGATGSPSLSDAMTPYTQKLPGGGSRTIRPGVTSPITAPRIPDLNDVLRLMQEGGNAMGGAAAPQSVTPQNTWLGQQGGAPRSYADTLQQPMTTPQHDQVMSQQAQQLADAQGRIQHAQAIQAGTLGDTPIPQYVPNAPGTARTRGAQGEIYRPGTFSGSRQGRVGTGREAEMLDALKAQALQDEQASQARSALVSGQSGILQRVLDPQAQGGHDEAIGIARQISGMNKYVKLGDTATIGHGVSPSMGGGGFTPVSYGGAAAGSPGPSAGYAADLADRKARVRQRGIDRASQRDQRMGLRKLQTTQANLDGTVTPGLSPQQAMVYQAMQGGEGEDGNFMRNVQLFGRDAAMRMQTEQNRSQYAQDRLTQEAEMEQNRLKQEGDIAAGRLGVEQAELDRRTAQDAYAQSPAGKAATGATLYPNDPLFQKQIREESGITGPVATLGQAPRDPSTGVVSQQSIEQFLSTLQEGTPPDIAMQQAQAMGITRHDLESYLSENQPGIFGGGGLVDQVVSSVGGNDQGQGGRQGTSFLEDLLGMMGIKGARGYATFSPSKGAGRRVKQQRGRSKLLGEMIGGR